MLRESGHLHFIVLVDVLVLSHRVWDRRVQDEAVVDSHRVISLRNVAQGLPYLVYGKATIIESQNREDDRDVWMTPLRKFRRCTFGSISRGQNCSDQFWAWLIKNGNKAFVGRSAYEDQIRDINAVLR